MAPDTSRIIRTLRVFTLSYIYDAAGNVTQITYPDQSAVVYTYDAANRLLTVTNWLAEQATYTYDQAGRLATFTNFNGIVTTYSYDGASRLTGMGSTVASYQFTLDGNGNRIHSTETEPLSPTLSPGSTVYDYNTQRNRLLSAGAVNYTYDDEGQLATSGAVSYTFDCDHRLIGIGTGTQFMYDGLGNRLGVVRGGVTTRYIYDPYGNILAEADANGITRKYIYGSGLLAVATSDARYCYHFDATGHTIALTDMTGTVVNSYTYEPFGQILGQQETVAQPFKYVGQYGVMAEPDGLYYMRARYYDPGVGRFISEDPLGFGGGDVNLLAYVQNNPIDFVDPYGLARGGLKTRFGYAKCNSAEMAACVAQCGAKGVESCRMAIKICPKVKDGKISPVAPVQKIGMSCSCNPEDDGCRTKLKPPKPGQIVQLILLLEIMFVLELAGP